jgi:hypothetical protein
MINLTRIKHTLEKVELFLRRTAIDGHLPEDIRLKARILAGICELVASDVELWRN